MEFFPFRMLQSVGPELVAIDGEGGGQSSSAVCITNQSHNDLFVFHADNHALPVAEGEEKDQGVEDDSLNRGSKGDEVGTKPDGFEDKSNVRDGEIDFLVVGCRGKTHDIGALVVDPLANLRNSSSIQRT